jgi:hypothetical protein
VLTDRPHSEFLKAAYPSLKEANPNLPFLIREAQGTPARIFARFGELAVGQIVEVWRGAWAQNGTDRAS